MEAGVVFEKETSNGKIVTVYPRMFNTIITIGDIGSLFYDDQW